MCMLNCVYTLIASSTTDKSNDNCKTTTIIVLQLQLSLVPSMRYGTNVFWAIIYMKIFGAYLLPWYTDI